MWTSAWRVSSAYSTTRYRESQVLLAVYSHRLDIYLVGCDLRAHLSIDHRCVSFFFFACLITVGYDHEIISTAKFSRSIVVDFLFNIGEIN